MAKDITLEQPKLALSMKQTEHALDIGKTQLYEEINAKRLKTYKVGRRRFTTPEWCREWQMERATENARSGG